MDNVVSTFPLLRLPKKAILRTLRIMTYRQILGISFLSKKTKDLVESLKITTETFHVQVRSYFLIILFFRNSEAVSIELCRFQAKGPLRTLETPGDIYFYSEKPGRWTNSLSVRHILDHLKLICHSPITTLKFLFYQIFSLESVYRNVTDIQTICLISRNHEQNRRIISVLKPASISFESRALINESVPRYFLIQNFDDIYVSPNFTVQITLDELLITNARRINLSCSGLTVKILNQFIKLWTKGSNPRLEWMNLRFPGNFQNEELLRGLKYQRAPRNTKRYFKSSVDKKPKIVHGGCDVWRLDGTQATIKGYGGDNEFDFQLFVWHEHCIVN